MSSSPLEKTPLEIMMRICEYIKSTHPLSLREFALVSKRCRSAANRLLHRTIKIKVGTPEQLVRNLDAHKKMLQNAASLGNVRTLLIEGAITTGSESSDDGKALTQSYCDPSTPVDEKDELLRPIKSSYSENLGRLLSSTKSMCAMYEEDPNWQPLANFIRQLSTLADLVFASTSQLPPCILKILHEHRPECRLHMPLFRLHSLGEVEMDPHELALACSPCLHSVTLYYHWREGLDWRFKTGKEDYNEEALMGLIAGMAPRIQSVGIHRGAHFNYNETDAAELDRPRRPWNGFPASAKQVTSSKGRLQRLQIDGIYRSSVSLHELRRWNEITTFASLRLLILQTPLDADALQYLATECDFSSLVSLTLCVYSHTDSDVTDAEYVICISSFLRRIPPLHSLTYEGRTSDEISRAIYESHGNTLRYLVLSWHGDCDPVLFDQAEVERLSRHCPMLTTLGVVIPRTKGDSDEIAIYRSLGAMPNLRNVRLALDVTDYTIPVPPPSFYIEDDDEFEALDQVYRSACAKRPGQEQDVSNAFVNAAIDEGLAKSIFAKMASSKTSTFGHLNSLVLYTVGGRNVFPSYNPGSFDIGYETIMKWLGKSRLLERHPRDDKAREVVIKEFHSIWSKSFLETRRRLPWNLEPAFRNVWPETYPGSHWNNDWSSRPLQE